jgi:hypothetical protein
MFQVHNELELPVRVLGQHLKAGKQGHEGGLIVESNGGTEVVLVRVEVPVVPFPSGVLAGATTPRQVAEKARANPREAAVLFEQGAVAAWYESNGWTYPVRGPSASGIGAVQQFFEALGLAAAPRVDLLTRRVLLQGPPGATLEAGLMLQAQERRPVFAHAVSQIPWLQIGQPLLEGRTAHIPLRVLSVPYSPGETLSGPVHVTANGNQRFTAEVTLTVEGTVPRRSQVFAAAAAVPVAANGGAPAAIPLAPPPVPENDFREAFVPASRPITPLPSSTAMPVVPVTPDVGRRRGWMHLLPVAFILLGLSVTVVRDLASRTASPSGAGDAEEAIDPTPRIALQFHDSEMDVVLGSGGIKSGPHGRRGDSRPAIWEPSMRFGLVMLGPDRSGQRNKRLTFEEQGLTNNTCVRLDGKESLFGERPFRPVGERSFRPVGEPPSEDWPGRWEKRDLPLPPGPGRRDGRRSVWVYEDQQVFVTQTVEIVAGPQSGLFDTCLVRYELENRDSVSHRIGLRFLLDTYIGGNDGVPFLVPGARQLCSTRQDFRRAEDVPDFIQACENENLSDPGTVAQVGLKVPGLETPTRVTLGSYPDPRLARLDDRCKQEKTRWEVPVLPIHSLEPGDSAVTIYWADRPLPPGGRRVVGFTYGLGNVAGGEGKGRLALTTGGYTAPGDEFPVTAYVHHPTPGQRVRLTLPPDFALVEGAADQEVPPPPADATRRTSPVTWRVRAPRQEGTFTLKVESNNGLTQTQPIKVRARNLFGGN